MYLKRSGYHVLLISTITVTLAPTGRCQPTTLNPNLNLDPQNDRNVGLKRKNRTHASNQEDRQPLLDSREPGNQPSSSTAGDGSRTRTSDGNPRRRFGHRRVSPTRAQNIRKQSEWERMLSTQKPPNEDCSPGEIKPVVNGKFYIPGQFEANVGYQSDSAVSGQMRTWGQHLSSSEETWQRLQPVVECGDHTMTLTVRRRQAAQVLLDRANESSVPVPKLPPQCGYSIQTTLRDLRLVAPYDACHVTQEDDGYVLPLLWRGSPVKMMCPVSVVQPEDVGPSSLCCSPYGMIVRVRGLLTTQELRVKVRGEWTPLVLLAQQCDYTLDRQGNELLIAAPFMTCGITLEDGKHTLSLQIGEKAFTLGCPVPSPEELPPAGQALVDSPHQIIGPAESVPWAPPFYLAPPYYPHPTYHHKSSGPDAFKPPRSSTPEPTFGPPAIPRVDPQPDDQDDDLKRIPVREWFHGSLSSSSPFEDSSQAYSSLLGLSKQHSATGFPIQVEAPSLQPQSYTLNSYYHYYHHPKIPQSGPHEDPDPGPEVLAEQSYSPILESTKLYPNIQQKKAPSRVDLDQHLQPPPEGTSLPYTPPTSPKLSSKIPGPDPAYPPYLFPYQHFYYFPYIARGESKKLEPNTDTAKNDGSNLKLNTHVYPHPHPLVSLHNKYDLSPHTREADRNEMLNLHEQNTESTKHPLLSKNMKADAKTSQSVPVSPANLSPSSCPLGPEPVAAPPPEPSSLAPLSNHSPYHHYQTYYNLQSADDMFPTSSKEELDLQMEDSSPPSQDPRDAPSHLISSPDRELVFDVQKASVHPYHRHFQPQMSVDKEKPPLDDQEMHHIGSINSEKETPLSPEAGVLTAWLGDPRYSSLPQSQGSPLDGFDPHYISQEHQYDPSKHPGMEKAEDCTMGQLFVFRMPDTLMEPTLSPYPSEISNFSCNPQKLTSDPDLYVVPLEGCGVTKHVFGHTVVHLLEVRGFHSLQQNSDSVDDDAPVRKCTQIFGLRSQDTLLQYNLSKLKLQHQINTDRLMVECRASPGSPGDVRFHLMDNSAPSPVQSPPATVNVQLGIATDESFTSYHPKAHLPLSLLRGKPVYMEVRLLDPQEPNLVLLVHSCLAYIPAPYASWMLIYDGCPSRGGSQLLPSHAHHIRRILVTSFLSLPVESPSYVTEGGFLRLDDPEIYFLCLTEVCAAANGDCAVGCINRSSKDM